MDQYLDPALFAAGFAPVLMLAGIGYLFTDRAGVFQIGVEGLMLVSAFFDASVNSSTNNPWLGLLAGVAASLAMSGLFYVFGILWQADIVIVGIAINILAAGGTTYLSAVFYGSEGQCCQVNPTATLPSFTLSGVASLPIVGPSVTNQSVLVYIAWLSVAVASVVLYRTRLGLHIRAVGENAEAAATVAIPVRRVQLIAIMICGMLCGLAGAYFVEQAGQFTQQMTAGNGFIALAAETFGNATPIGTFLAALLFGLAQSLSDHVTSLPSLQQLSQFVSALPYAVTIIALILTAARVRGRERKRQRIAHSATA